MGREIGGKSKKKESRKEMNDEERTSKGTGYEKKGGEEKGC